MSMNILIADDERDLVAYLKERISIKGHNVEGAYDGETTLELIKRNKYDIVFLDHDMPGKTGLEVARYIRDNRIPTKMVMITGYEDIEEFLARAVGMDEYLEKPLKMADIDAILKKYDKKA